MQLGLFDHGMPRAADDVACGRMLAVAAPDSALDTAELRKSRGAFFTPEPVARHITDWAVRSTADRILEPSCGEASFLLAAVDRLAALRAPGAEDSDLGHLDGIELHADSARAAEEILSRVGVDARISTGDFFCCEPTGSYDVVIGNPPYVRYQDFSGEARTRSREAALRAGVALSRLASSWAAFTVHSALFLRPGGRMGLVLPAELLSVNYAAEIRRFLLDSFERVELVLFNERVFPGVLEDVVLLLAEGYRQGPTEQATVRYAQNAGALAALDTKVRVWQPVRAEDKWTPSLLPEDALGAYAGLLSGGGFVPLEAWGDTTLGMVTGNNRWFCLSPERVAELGLEARDLERLCPPGSRHLRELEFSPATWSQLGETGSATWLFRPSGEPSRAGWDYIAAGEADDVHTAYKCRVRTPWWRVPISEPADMLVTYMNADTPRLTSNIARVRHLNSVHGLYLSPDLRALGTSLLPLASLTSMTLVGAETVGRSYGGGMLKLEPKEADQLPVPHPDVVRAAQPALERVRPKIASLLANKSGVVAAAALIDDVLLEGELGVARSEIAALREAHAGLTARRFARGRDAK
ncbi:HsdM family class I SAM-dependent methyltransferase [Pseudonocardia phyllosphaerae]|uniref:HsdM family class I SAM-dependent methyltransferase n=1 Tax=Pseudonocardia phyllosphaerae TaxID=3390502 RepID=UPI00397DB349